MAYNKITDEMLEGKGNVGRPDTPMLSTAEMQRVLDEIPREVIVPFINALVDELNARDADTYSKSETEKAISDKMAEIGAGDMSKAVYDDDGDGIVNSADNGIFTYTHSKTGTVHNIVGKGENVKFFPTADWNPGDTLYVNGVKAHCYNSEAERLEGETLFKANVAVTCVLGTIFTADNETVRGCFFKTGGAGLNFKIVGGTTEPASPKENTMWVNTALEITEWAFDTEAPDYLPTGGIWIKTGTNGIVEINAVKKNSIYIYPQSCMQWDGTQWINRDVKVYKNGQWLALRIWFLQKNNPFAETTGGWAAIDSPNGVHVPATITDEGMVFNTSGLYYGEMATVSPIDFSTINTLYFSVPSIYNVSGNSGRRFSMGINPQRTHKLVNNIEQEGWLVEKFIANPTAGTNMIYTLDTSSVNSACYILIATGCGGSDTTLTVVIDEIYGV